MEYDILFITVAVFAMVGIAAFSTVATNESEDRMAFGLASKHPSHGGVEPRCFAA